MEIFSSYVEKVQWDDLLFTALRILLVLVLAWLAMALVKVALRRLEQTLIEHGREAGDVLDESAKRAETLIMLWVMAGLVILRELGVEIAPILASAGIVGLAVGFGAQNLVRDVISGFFIILENQVRVGDVAVVNGTGGLVEKVNFRTLVLRDLSGVVHIFPNGTVTTLSNMTKEWSAYVFDIGIAYKEDTDRVVEIMRRVGAELREDHYFGAFMIDDVEIFGVDQFADSAVIVKGRLRTRPIKQWEVGREYRRRLKQAFDREGVEIPFPHRSIYFGEASKPIDVMLKSEVG
jgi:small-conductance mechanosensitive channel